MSVTVDTTAVYMKLSSIDRSITPSIVDGLQGRINAQHGMVWNDIMHVISEPLMGARSDNHVLDYYSSELRSAVEFVAQGHELSFIDYIAQLRDVMNDDAWELLCYMVRLSNEDSRYIAEYSSTPVESPIEENSDDITDTSSTDNDESNVEYVTEDIDDNNDKSSDSIEPSETSDDDTSNDEPNEYEIERRQREQRERIYQRRSQRAASMSRTATPHKADISVELSAEAVRIYGYDKDKTVNVRDINEGVLLLLEKEVKRLLAAEGIEFTGGLTRGKLITLSLVVLLSSIGHDHVEVSADGQMVMDMLRSLSGNLYEETQQEILSDIWVELAHLKETMDIVQRESRSSSQYVKDARQISSLTLAELLRVSNIESGTRPEHMRFFGGHVDTFDEILTKQLAEKQRKERERSGRQFNKKSR